MSSHDRVYTGLALSELECNILLMPGGGLSRARVAIALRA